MSMTTNNQTLREAAEKAASAHDRISIMPTDDIFDISLAEGTQLDDDITALNAFHTEASPATVLAKLDELESAERRNAELMELLQWTHDTLLEINPNNYTHNDVCEANAASVEVILGIAPTLGETHGYTKEWWESRAAATDKGE